MLADPTYQQLVNDPKQSKHTLRFFAGQCRNSIGVINSRTLSCILLMRYDIVRILSPIWVWSKFLVNMRDLATSNKCLFFRSATSF